MKFSLIEQSDTRSLTVLYEGELYPVTDVHPAFDTILQRVRDNDESFLDLLDARKAVSHKLETLTSRLSLRGNQLLFDGDPVDDAFTEALVRFHNEGVEDWKPLAAFYENLYSNVTEDSRDQLARWVKAQNLTITHDGMILGYKGVHRSTKDPNFPWESTRAGHGFVDGVEYHNSTLPQTIGSVVTMPRSEVTHDPNVTCSVGLHVGTYAYASSFASVVLKVIVDPRDVVSVPTDYNGAKVRVSRYVVDSEAERVVESPVYVANNWYYEDEDDDGDDYDYFGSPY